jgi:aryl-alcohol dehydrogenase-like predicted oxidoreductase
MNSSGSTPMPYRTLGRTGLRISALAFGAGPVSTLLVGNDADRQHAVVAHAIARGINWFDTAATYGGGDSETNLGRALANIGATGTVHVATKVRLSIDDLADIRGAVERSIAASLQRLRRPTVTLLQLHNSITPRRGDEPTSITPADVLGPGGVAEAFAELRVAGKVRFLGLTGIGAPQSLREVVRSRLFDTMQVPYHLLNPSAGCHLNGQFTETNYGNIIADCADMQMGVLAIRIFAAGALLGNPPSPHTLKTPFFPLDLYERDRQRAAALQQQLGPTRSLAQEAVRFALAHPDIHSAIIGFGAGGEIDAALDAISSDAAAATSACRT